MSQEPGIYRGSCLCEAVKYEIHGDPFTFRICHCINCRKATGTAFMSNGFFSRDKVRVVEGQEKVKVFEDKKTTSGVALARQFCSECGSNVFITSTDPEHSKKFVIVALGTLDQETDWLPKMELFADQRRHWVNGIHLVTGQKL